VYPDSLADFLIVTIAGIALGSALGFPSPAPGWAARLGRVAGTALAGLALGAALGGISALLVGKLGVPERKLPISFLPVSVPLVALGLRRLPRARWARFAVGLPVAGLAVMRLLALWPAGAHAITRRILPLGHGAVRAELSHRGWGPMAGDGRTRLIALESTPSYRTDDGWLAGDADMKFTLEVTKPFFEDACG